MGGYFTDSGLFLWKIWGLKVTGYTLKSLFDRRKVLLKAVYSTQKKKKTKPTPKLAGHEAPNHRPIEAGRRKPETGL